MMPNPIFTSPFDMNAGMIVWSGRLRGAIWFGCPSSSVKSAPRLCSITPVPGATMPLPNDEYRLWISETMLPSRSMTDR